MAEHGTRTMYVHYGCRCAECCKAEHKQYLKREIAQTRKRTFSKWGTDDIPAPAGDEKQRRYNKKRYWEFKSRPSEHNKPIRWHELASSGKMTCAICGCSVDPSDTWINDGGRKCFGRKYPTVDHIAPLKNGGTDTIDNVQLVCKQCNSKKGAKEYVNIS